MPLNMICFFQLLTYSYNFLLIFACLIESKKPRSKRLQTTWRLECELGIIIDSDCPIDGSWSPWSPWSNCFGPCDNVGHRKRVRECNNPPPSKDGMPCNGFEQESEPCYLTNCSVNDYRKLIEGDIARTEALHTLEAVPLLMVNCLRIQCPYEAIEAALAKENIWQMDSEALWNALQCVKHDLGCSLKGEWGPWGSWSSCGARCGKGLRWRQRRCDTPSPSAAHLICAGTPMQHDNCEGDQCAIDGEYMEHNTSGSWGEWSEWTKCSEQCGNGIRRRKRTCIEKRVPLTSVTWGTHCRGQYDQLDICNNSKCILNGGWSGWGPWGPCSQTCGVGKRSRTRSCTRPIPSDEGEKCVGSKVEVGSCHLTPCEVYNHNIAVFNGDSVLHYNFSNKKSTFLHFYIRFMPLSPHGTLIRRGTTYNPRVRLSLQKWHICLDATGSSKSCSLPRTCSPSALEPSVWHNILITVTNEAATLRLNDAHTAVQSSFPCDPELTNDEMNIFIGEKLHGEVQELILNFIPLKLVIERERRNTQYDFVPSSTSNVVYEKANMDEAYLYLENGQYLRVPCFKDQNEWQLDLTLKSKKESGAILYLSNDNLENWFYMTLQDMRLKIKLVYDEFQSEAVSSTECYPDHWMHILLIKKRDTNIITATINSAESFHVYLTENIINGHRKSITKDTSSKYSKNLTKNINVNNKCQKMQSNFINNQQTSICSDEFFIGGTPIKILSKISEDIPCFSGVIASIKINNHLEDFHDFVVERNKDGIIQLSSRTASVSGFYHETSWGESNRLNLTCLHARNTISPESAYWIYLDTEIEVKRDKNQRSIDDGNFLRLLLTGNVRQGFYTCRAHINRRTRNFVTYGVLGKLNLKFTSPDKTTIIAIFTTVSLVILTLGWIIIEGFLDFRDGYGFFRDANLSPEEEAEVVCDYIDQNMHLMGSESAVNLAKNKTRRRGKRLATRASFDAQEPEGIPSGAENLLLNESTRSETVDLPALPEIQSSAREPSQYQIFRCEPSYISSPRHGSLNTSPRTKLSSSSLDSSPRVLCSRLLMTRYKKSNEKPKKIIHCSSNESKSPLMTIKSTPVVNTSPAQKVLQKFMNLNYSEV